LIDLLVCGLMTYYNVNCIEFHFYETNNAFPWPHTPYNFVADSTKYGKLGIINIYNTNPKLRDACGMTILEHELQRFHQDRWDFGFCNLKNEHF